MKRPLLWAVPVLAAILLVWLGLRMAAPDDVSARLDPTSASAPLPPPTTTQTDPTEVFKRAFWKRPTDEDKILHAERQEWADEDGLDRWQWFIAVDPSEDLARYLNEQNPFSLTEPKGAVALPREQVPEWFPDSAEGFGVRQSLDGQMIFLTDADSGRLFATSQGRGFAKPAEMTPRVSAPAVQAASIPGRLPNSPPPLPKKP